MLKISGQYKKMHGKNRVSAWKGVGTTFMITLKNLKE